MSYDAASSHHHAERAPSKRQERRSQEVWSHNLEEEIKRMIDVAELYQHVAMDSQFPEVIAKLTGPFLDYTEYHYQTLKWNMDLTKVIQMGFTFSDAKGNRPKGISTWRFNFVFNTSTDLIGQDAIECLRNTRGVDLGKHHSQGIDRFEFGVLMMGTGIVLNEEMRWITYGGTRGFMERPPEGSSHGRSAEPPWLSLRGMYDFAHLWQILTARALPRGENEVEKFYENLDTFFPKRCDMARHTHRLPQLNVRNAPHILEAFFRLPDSIRRTAFDPVEDTPVVTSSHHRPHRKHREHDEARQNES